MVNEQSNLVVQLVNLAMREDTVSLVIRVLLVNIVVVETPMLQSATFVLWDITRVLQDKAIVFLVDLEPIVMLQVWVFAKIAKLGNFEIIVTQLLHLVETVLPDSIPMMKVKVHVYPVVQVNLMMFLVLLNAKIAMRIHITATKVDNQSVFHVK